MICLVLRWSIAIRSPFLEIIRGSRRLLDIPKINAKAELLKMVLSSSLLFEFLFSCYFYFWFLWFLCFFLAFHFMYTSEIISPSQTTPRICDPLAPQRHRASVPNSKHVGAFAVDQDATPTPFIIAHCQLHPSLLIRVQLSSIGGWLPHVTIRMQWDRWLRYQWDHNKAVSKANLQSTILLWAP